LPYLHITTTTYLLSLFFFLLIPPPPTSPLFPYTTLFRSFPPTNHFAYGGFHSRTRSHLRSQSSCSAHPAQNPSRSLSAFCQMFSDRKSTRLNSSHLGISYAVFCLKKKNKTTI